MKALLAFGLCSLTSVTAGCGAAPFPKDLFTIDATTADYPVMLSRAPNAGGRAIEASSGRSASAEVSSRAVGNSRVSVATFVEAQSELSASVQLAAQVQRADKWVSLRRATWRAHDFSTYGAATSERGLRIEAAAHR